MNRVPKVVSLNSIGLPSITSNLQTGLFAGPLMGLKNGGQIVSTKNIQFNIHLDRNAQGIVYTVEPPHNGHHRGQFYCPL